MPLAKKRFKLLLLVSFVLLFGIERHYSVVSVPGGKANLQPPAPAVTVESSVPYILSDFFFNYTLYQGFLSFSYWLFDLYQEQPGWYTCKFFYAVGYRTRLFYDRFYLDFFIRPVMMLLFFIWSSLKELRLMFFGSGSSSDSTSESLTKTEKEMFLEKKELYTNIKRNIWFAPFVDLNIRLGESFYLVIGFTTIFISYYCSLEDFYGHKIEALSTKRRNYRTNIIS